jgi:hypothetical protein
MPLWRLGADGSQRIASLRRSNTQGDDESGSGNVPLLAKAVSFGDGCGATQRDNTRKPQAGPSQEELQRLMHHNKSEKDAVVVATRAVAGEKALLPYNAVMGCFKRKQVDWSHR